MEIERALKAELEAVILMRLGDQNVRSVDLDSIEVSEENFEIRITVFVKEEADPRELAQGYFGLTSGVRKTLGDKWRNFFPVITPVSENKVCA